MNEGSLYDADLAALALKQAQGDSIEAAFLLRAYRTTLARFGSSMPLDTGAMHIERRISATYKDLPGGQVLGPTYDYTHRLFDFSLMTAGQPPASPATSSAEPLAEHMPRVHDILGGEGLLEAEHRQDGDSAPFDLTRESLEFLADRDARLQALSRGDEARFNGAAIVGIFHEETVRARVATRVLDLAQGRADRSSNDQPQSMR